ncbi:hypothetical protein GCM10010446_51330 [Streptomyces enissocaesilis]|uniref:Uncharacterized protein n=1 Tax=Streptomyces enissocaesilis TaxID=332589 RepID=A0ABP6K111_9ACTN
MGAAWTQSGPVAVPATVRGSLTVRRRTAPWDWSRRTVSSRGTVPSAYATHGPEPGYAPAPVPVPVARLAAPPACRGHYDGSFMTRAALCALVRRSDPVSCSGAPVRRVSRGT